MHNPTLALRFTRMHILEEYSFKIHQNPTTRSGIYVKLKIGRYRV